MSHPKDYLSCLVSWKDEPIIKAITGKPGSSKTTLLANYHQHLHSQGVTDEQIIAINFGGIKAPMDYRSLHQSITDRLNPHRMTYILLDEIPRVTGFEKAIASLYAKKMVDIYMTGSAADLLSSEDATLLSGRYVQISLDEKF